MTTTQHEAAGAGAPRVAEFCVAELAARPGMRTEAGAGLEVGRVEETHAPAAHRWRSTTLEPGRWLWRSPHGELCLRDHRAPIRSVPSGEARSSREPDAPSRRRASSRGNNRPDPRVQPPCS